MEHRTSGLNKILVPRESCRPTGRFLAILSAEIFLTVEQLRQNFIVHENQRGLRLGKLIPIYSEDIYSVLNSHNITKNAEFYLG
jgi:hypothetical protein